MSRRIYLIIYICCCVLTTLAQTTDEQYRKIYDAAERDYNIGRIMEAENQLKDNLRIFPQPAPECLQVVVDVLSEYGS